MRQFCIRLFIPAVVGLLFCVQSAALDVNDYTFRHLTHSDGLCSQRIYSIRQTPDGAVWWAAKNCVERFNGVSVKCYKLEAPQDVSFYAGRYLKLFLSSSGELYAFDNKGEIFAYNPISDTFSLFADLRSLIGSELILNDIHISGDAVFLAADCGILKLEDGKVRFVMEGVSANAVAAAEGRLYFCTADGVLEHIPSLGDASLKKIVPGNIVSAFYDGRGGSLWIGCFADGVKVVSFAVNGKVDAVSPVLSEDADIRNPVRSICLCGEDAVLLGIDGLGVYEAARRPDNAGRYPARLLFDANNGRNGVLSGNGVYSVICDLWGNIIVGSYSGGIDIAHPVGMASKIFRHQHNNRQSILNDHVNCVIQTPDGRLAMGTDNGVSIYDEGRNAWVHSSDGHVVIDLCVLSDGRLVAATYGGGVLEILPDSRARQLYCVKNGTLRDDYVYCIFEDRDKGLWMGCLDGPLVYMNKGSVSCFDLHNVKDMLQLPDGRVAVGTVNGLFLIDPVSGEMAELDYSPADAADVSRYVCTMFLQDGSTLWVGTDGGGLYVCDINSLGGGRQILASDGLPSNTVSSICEDAYGRILIATDYGLAYIDPDFPEKVVNVNYGYDVDCEYVSGAVASLSDSRILYGTTTGALIINPGSLKELDYVANLNILGIRCDADGDCLCENGLSLQSGRIEIDYSCRTFDLCFECVNLNNQKDIAYTYRIGDGEWSEPGPVRYIRFINMAAGEYELTLRCVSRSCGVVLDEETVVIKVARPWWRSWWMWTLYVLMVIIIFCALWYFYRLHTQYMRLVVNNPKLFSLPLPVRRPEKKRRPVQEKRDEGKDFVEKATGLIVGSLSDSAFTIDTLCREMAMSRTMFYLKLKTYTGKSPQDFIRVIRLERAAALLRAGTPVAEAASMTGFDNPKYFSTVFKKYFGLSPSKYR